MECFLQNILQAGDYQQPKAFINATIRKPFPTLPFIYFLCPKLCQAIAHSVAKHISCGSKLVRSYSCNKNISDEDFLLQLQCFLDEKRNNKAFAKAAYW